MSKLPYNVRKNKFIDGLNSFKDISVDDTPEIIDYLGHEGFNTSEDAEEYLNDKIVEYNDMGDPITLYRIVGVKNKKLIDLNNKGESFTPYKWLLNGDLLMSIGYENWEDGVKPYVMEVSCPLSEINAVRTIVQNLAFPNEHEIVVKNKGVGCKVIKVYKL
jgi:hypothetical protein